MKPTCETCIYSTELAPPRSSRSEIVCHRHPASSYKPADWWCGEGAWWVGLSAGGRAAVGYTDALEISEG